MKLKIEFTWINTNGIGCIKIVLHTNYNRNEKNIVWMHETWNCFRIDFVMAIKRSNEFWKGFHLMCGTFSKSEYTIHNSNAFRIAIFELQCCVNRAFTIWLRALKWKMLWMLAMFAFSKSSRFLRSGSLRKLL